MNDEFINLDESAHKFSTHDSESSSTGSFSPEDENLGDDSMKKSKQKTAIQRSPSPTSALAKAKFSPVIEQALLSLQTSKFNSNLYAVQPKFGIKRLKCRHCFYRSNWKTDMIRHVRIRHNLTEPDHNRGLHFCPSIQKSMANIFDNLDMIMMSEQEARSTIESYENTFGKELRRRTFRTWNDWTKAEQEFTPKDGSLQYVKTTHSLQFISHFFRFRSIR